VFVGGKKRKVPRCSVVSFSVSVYVLTGDPSNSAGVQLHDASRAPNHGRGLFYCSAGGPSVVPPQRAGECNSASFCL
jgi:hypothetical protein